MQLFEKEKPILNLGNLELDHLLKVNLVHFTIEHNHKISPKLTQKEFQIFQSLKENPTWAATRAHLVQKVWENTYVCAKTFDVHLVSLRRKLFHIGIEILFEPPYTYRVVVARNP